jgi:hypothetical protein
MDEFKVDDCAMGHKNFWKEGNIFGLDVLLIMDVASL